MKAERKREHGRAHTRLNEKRENNNKKKNDTKSSNDTH